MTTIRRLIVIIIIFFTSTLQRRRKKMKQNHTDTNSVFLYVYDLSGGQAKKFSESILGVKIDAIYHTSIVVYGKEFWFGKGVNSCPPGFSGHGKTIEEIDMGFTEVPSDLFEDYMYNDLSDKYNETSYNLLENNCNNFSNDMLNFLVGKGVPKHILDIVDIVKNSPGYEAFMNLLKMITN